MEGQSAVFTHGDLDWGNILMLDKTVCGQIDMESSLNYIYPQTSFVFSRYLRVFSIISQCCFTPLSVRFNLVAISQSDSMSCLSCRRRTSSFVVHL